MKTGNTISLESHAAATLRYIRASMDGANSMALPGSAGFAVGGIGCGAAALSLLPGLHDRWLVLWLCAGVIAGGVGGALIARPATLGHLLLTGTPLRRFVLGLIPGLFAGAVATAVLWSAGITQPIRGVWLVSYGCALISASAVTTSMLTVMGGLFVALGLVALGAADAPQAILMGVGFGGLHLLFAILIGRENRRGREA